MEELNRTWLAAFLLYWHRHSNKWVMQCWNDTISPERKLINQNEPIHLLRDLHPEVSLLGPTKWVERADLIESPCDVDAWHHEQLHQ